MSNQSALKSRDEEKHYELTQLVSFIIDQEEYGVEVLKVREIIRMVSITHMPNAPDFVEGIINLRGKVIPIISMRRKFGLMEKEFDQYTRVIIMDVGGELLGFTVDSVSEVIRISSDDIQQSPSVAAGSVGQEFISGVINHGEKLLIVLDLDRMFTGEERQIIGEL